MKTTWWRSLTELDDDQRSFINLPKNGRYALIGPPGSGKTNLLLLRAQYLAGAGEKNVLILTYTNGLRDFIRSGIAASRLVAPEQVRTFHSWAGSHILEHLGPIFKGGGEFDEQTRDQVTQLLQHANNRLPTRHLYSAIFVDEAQDLTVDELESLLCLSPNVCVCGDDRQGIYHKDGLAIIKKLGLSEHSLKRHFRIGHRIARVADRLMPPDEGDVGLEATSNYNPKLMGNSSAQIHVCVTRDDQFACMLKIIRVQLDAFKDDTIGIFCGTNDSISELCRRFDETDLRGMVCVHAVDTGANFGNNKPIHVLTIHAAKGTEFRAVHLFGIEELAKFPLNRRHLAYTAITRAKTALNAYRSGPTNAAIENAFAEPADFHVEELFSTDK